MLLNSFVHSHSLDSEKLKSHLRERSRAAKNLWKVSNRNENMRHETMREAEKTQSDKFKIVENCALFVKNQ